MTHEGTAPDKAIIFDIDGVLIDSYHSHLQSWQQVAHRYDRQMSENDFASTFGRTTREIMQTLWKELELSEEEIEQFDLEKEAAFREIVVADYPWMDGAKFLISSLFDALLHDLQVDCVFATHTGIKWKRKLAQNKQFVNVGVLGRPENDGQTCVWYTLASVCGAGNLEVEFVAVKYDHHRLAREMASEGLPPEFQETILTGWWTTCLESLPAKERKRGRF